MTYSDRYKALIVAVSQLRKDLLPGYFKKNANYSREYITRTIAYHILVHAEIESYFESRAWETASKALQKWEKTITANRIILALIAFSGRTMEKPPDSIIPDQPSQSDRWDEKIRLNKKINEAKYISLIGEVYVRRDVFSKVNLMDKLNKKLNDF